jgi:ribosomal protein S3
MKYGFDFYFEDDSPNIEFEISNNQAGSIIGTNGENIKKLRKNYDCKIEILCVNKRRYLYVSGNEKFKVFGKIIYHLVK